MIYEYVAMICLRRSVLEESAWRHACLHRSHTCSTSVGWCIGAEWWRRPGHGVERHVLHVCASIGCLAVREWQASRSCTVIWHCAVRVWPVEQWEKMDHEYECLSLAPCILRTSVGV